MKVSVRIDRITTGTIQRGLSTTSANVCVGLNSTPKMRAGSLIGLCSGTGGGVVMSERSCHGFRLLASSRIVFRINRRRDSELREVFRRQLARMQVAPAENVLGLSGRQNSSVAVAPDGVAEDHQPRVGFDDRRAN